MRLKTLLPGLSIVVASLIWATDATVRARVFGEGSLRTVAFLEHLMAFAAVSPLVFQSRFSRVLPHAPKEWLQVLLLGAGGSAFAGILFTMGVEKLGPALAAGFTFLQPLFVLLFAYLFLKERSSSTFYFAALWVVANAILISFPFYGFELSEEAQAGLAGGALLAILAAVIWAGTAVAGKSLLRLFSPAVLLTWRFGFAATFLFISLFVAPEPVILTDLLNDRALMAVLYLGIVVNAIGFLFYYYGMRRLPLRVVAFVELLYPLIGVFIPIWSGGVPASPLNLIGSVTLLIAVGILLAMEYPRELEPVRLPVHEADLENRPY